jgi:hypothetical protein
VEFVSTLRYFNIGMTIRRIALVGPLSGERPAVHTAGYPLDPADMLPTADVVLLIDRGEGDCMLFRYTAFGELAGDTPHDSALDAEGQADVEYGAALLPWMDVPDDVDDAHDFAIRYAAERLNGRE